MLSLLRCLKEAGHGDRKQQKKSLKHAHETAIKIAKETHGIRRTSKGWQKKFNRLKQEHSQFISKIEDSGRSGDDPDLRNTPPFHLEMCELERDKARHSPPALLSTEALSISGAPDDTEGSEVQLTSSRKRKRESAAMSLDAMNSKAEIRHSELVELVKQQNDLLAANNNERSMMRGVILELVKKF